MTKRPKPIWMPPPGYIPPMPYAGVCPRCKVNHGGSNFTYREGAAGGNDARVWGYFCHTCELTPWWIDEK